jgi:hypothetical protein
MPYFFFGPLLAMGAFGGALVLLPPFFDTGLDSFYLGKRAAAPDLAGRAALGVISRGSSGARRNCRGRPVAQV